MHDYTAHDDPMETRRSAGARRLFTVLVLTVVGVTGAASTAAAGEPTAPASPAMVTKPLPDNDDQKGDDEPCGQKVETTGGEALVCPDWSPNGSIEVFESRDPGSKVIGHIDPAGDDFYFCQTRGKTHRLGEFVNDWWALTDADGAAGSGWVPETYFKGGGPNEKDRVLQDCPTPPRR
ncbi:hypothetical protein [Pseudonocardia adelaidensis]|uniref:SH3 domain-containing protein n=1 Tax=Pseudonocardia adelaidensis TaxID=648754 RepID=A0ABP9NML4_9PSEU